MKFASLIALAAVSSAYMLEETELEELKGCPVIRMIAKKCAKAHNKKACAMRVFKGLMKFPCFRAVATKCKKDKACWKAARPALMKCKKAVTRRMMKKMIAKFAKKQCGRDMLKMCKKNKKCWKKNEKAAMKCMKHGKEEEELVELNDDPINKKCWKKNEKAADKKACVMRVAKAMKKRMIMKMKSLKCGRTLMSKCKRNKECWMKHKMAAMKCLKHGREEEELYI